ncbi:TonB-dependent receptor plug domain-containing protein [Flavobacterium sp. ZS1P70]|uniref:TonB-dependent receptor plug domain-containing protein n=1 Tax=Flavobacterium zhoui TaxID=3230414 RepID=A0ABW6I3P8_9FLAO
MKIFKLLLFVLLLNIGFANAQKKLTGKVVNNKNQPIAKAKIYLDSIDSNVETNKNGYFEVQLPVKVASINIYSYEYGLLSSKFNDESIMNFVFLDSEKATNKRIKKGEKIKIGYSEENKKYQVLNSRSIGAADDKNSGIYNNIFDLIRGRLSGVTVSRDNKITIRGVSSIRNISDPLFVVDGMIVSSIDYISPNIVKSISILKGAEASVYGSQGSSGVIVIKTK